MHNLITSEKMSRESFIRDHLHMTLRSAAGALDVSEEELILARTPKTKRGLGSGIFIFKNQFRKFGINVSDTELALILGVPVKRLKDCQPSRAEIIRAMRSAGESLSEIANALKITRAAVVWLSRRK